MNGAPGCPVVSSRFQKARTAAADPDELAALQSRYRRPDVSNRTSERLGGTAREIVVAARCADEALAADSPKSNRNSELSESA